MLNASVTHIIFYCLFVQCQRLKESFISVRICSLVVHMQLRTFGSCQRIETEKLFFLKKPLNSCVDVKLSAE